MLVDHRNISVWLHGINHMLYALARPHLPAYEHTLPYRRWSPEITTHIQIDIMVGGVHAQIQVEIIVHVVWDIQLNIKVMMLIVLMVMLVIHMHFLNLVWI